MTNPQTQNLYSKQRLKLCLSPAGSKPIVSLLSCCTVKNVAKTKGINSWAGKIGHILVDNKMPFMISSVALLSVKLSNQPSNQKNIITRELFCSCSVTAYPASKKTVPPLNFVESQRLSRRLLLGDLLNGDFESLWVGTDDLGNLLLTLEDQKGWHGADAELLSDIWNLVDIKLGKVRVGVGFREPGGVDVSTETSICRAATTITGANTKCAFTYLTI